MKQIPTLYSNYQELMLDLDIFGKIISTPQQSIQEMKDALFEEFKLRKPLPTLTDKRYELSEQVSQDYRIAYNKELEMQDYESLIDLESKSDLVKDFSFEDLTPLVPKVKALFSYEQNIKDIDRKNILEKYSMETGEEFTKGVAQTEELFNSVKEDKSLILSDSEIDNLGKNLDDEEEYVEADSSEEDDYLDETFFEEEDSDEEEFEESEDGEDLEEDDEDSDEDEDDYQEESEDDEDSDEDEDDYLDETSFEEDDFEEDEASDDEAEDFDDEDEDSDDEDDSDEDEEDSDDEDEDYLDETDFEDPDEDEEDSDEEEEDSEDDSFTEDSEDDEDFEIEFDEPAPQINNVDESPPITPKQVNIPITPVEINNNIVKEEVVDRSLEPTDIRQFLRKHPRSDYNFVLKYFTKKQINDALKIGKIIKKGNILKLP